jgi:uncharacterized secreted protein with C-terminal beta-propeller domain
MTRNLAACPISTLVAAAAAVATTGCSENPWTRTAQEETALVQYATCDQLEADLKEMLVAEVEASFDQQRYWQSHYPTAVDSAPGAGADTSNAAPRQEGVDYSGTNNQEQGVDEADFVKTDGYHVYVINGNRVHIFGVPAFGELVPESTVQIEGSPREMLVDRNTNRAAVFSTIWPNTLPEGHPLRAAATIAGPGGLVAWRVNTITKLTIFDITDRTAPALVREVFVEGDYRAARLIADSVRMGAWSWLNTPTVRSWYDGTLTIDANEALAKAAVAALHLSDIVPRLYERLPDGSFRSYQLTDNRCQSFFRPTDSQARGVTSLLTIDLAASGLALDAQHVITNSANLYASTDFLYLAESAHDWWWGWWNSTADDQTNIHAFDISRPDRAVYVGSGRVHGVVNNTFSLGEKDGFLRVATTTGWETRWWLPADQRPVTQSHVWVLAPAGGRLARVGHVGGIAPGERIFAARFLGDQGYLVTFRQIDPLFTLDLSDPFAPRVVGEVQTPGVSTYLQAIENQRLLSIGFGIAGNEPWAVDVGLFDVSDFEHPTLQAEQPLSPASGWSWSPATYEHKAFQYFAPKKLLAVPVSSFRQTAAPNGGLWWSYYNRLVLVNVDSIQGLSLYGEIDHSPFYNSDPTRYWQYTDIERSIFMGDYIYAISDRGISVNRLADLQLVTSQPLPGWLPNTFWWWW